MSCKTIAPVTSGLPFTNPLLSVGVCTTGATRLSARAPFVSMKYVDGYVSPVLKKNLAADRRIATGAGKIWRKYGAPQFCECTDGELKTRRMRSFPQQSTEAR